MAPPAKTGRHPGIYIGLYCSSTISLLFFNKWLFTQIPDFRFVLTITWIQQFGVAAIIYILRPLMAPVIGHVGMSLTLFRRIAPVGVIAAIDYAFSNLALQALPMTIYEIVKSCAPAVVLSLSIFLGLIEPSIRLTAVVVIIVSGAVIGVYRPGGGAGHGGPSTITTIGLFYICMAALSAAAKSVAAQITLQGDRSRLPKRRRRGGDALASEMSSPCTPIEPIEGFGEGAVVGEDSALQLSREASYYGSVAGDGPARHSSARRRSSRRQRMSSVFSVYEGMPAEDRAVFDRYGPTNPATVACVCSAMTVLTVLPFAMLREHEGLTVWATTSTWQVMAHHIGLVFLGSTLSVVANICSFFVMREASALTYALVAVCQRGLTVIAAVLFLHEEMPPWAIGGFSLTMCGIIYYNRMASHGHHHHHKPAEASPTSIAVAPEGDADGDDAKSAISSASGLGGSVRSGSAWGRRSSDADSCCSREWRGERVRHSMAAVCGDSMFLAALDSHSDTSSSEEEDDESTDDDAPVRAAA